MQYFILLPGDTEKDALNEANLLGESSFDVFWAGTGLKILMHMVNNEPEALMTAKIMSDSGKKLSITEFLDEIKKLKVRSR
jgi:hypothetical protein